MAIIIDLNASEPLPMEANESVGQLCERLRSDYASRRVHLQSGKVGTANELYKRAVLTLRTIRIQAGASYPDVLRMFLQSADDDLCGFIAVEALWELPTESEAALLRISEKDGLVSFAAHYALAEWKKGTLSRLTDLDWK